MKKVIKISFLLIFALAQTHCSAVAEVISDLTNLDCDEWLQEEILSDLNELCRDLDGYMDIDTSSFDAAVSQAMPTPNFTTSHELFLLVTDSSGDPIAVAADDLTIEYTDGATTDTITGATVATLENAGELKASLAMVIDYSASILDDDLLDVISGLNVFFDNIIADATSSVYQSAIIKFSTDVDLIEDFTSTKADLLAAVDDDDYDREYTSLYDAIYDGITESAAENTSLKLVIVFTDGVDNDSEHTKDEVITYSQENDVPICVVGVGFADVNTLQELADDTGCFFIYKTLFTSLDSAFETFADAIDNFTVVTLPDSFAETTGTLDIAVDVGEAAAREITFEF